MSSLNSLVKRNTKLFFKDKGTFFSAMIAPLVILALYILFLGNVFRDSFKSNVPTTIAISDKVINAYVASWEISSILAVCCVSVAFIANMIMVQDRIDGAILDINMTPVGKSTLALSYFISTAIVTMIVCYGTLLVGFIYLACVGWFLSFADVAFIILDVFLVSLFGTTLSSIVSEFLNSQGAMSAVGTIVSSVYGFICGAYYPISQFSTGIKNVVVCLPGTYGTSLFRNHFTNGVFSELQSSFNFPDEVVEGMKDGFDINLYFFDNKVSVLAMFLVVIGAILLFTAIFVGICLAKKTRKKSDR